VDMHGTGTAERAITAAYDAAVARPRRAGPDQKTGGPIGEEPLRPATTRVDPEEMQKAVTEANHTLRSTGRRLEFSVDQGSKTSVVKLIDEQSGEVIRQFPPEVNLRIRAFYRELQGLLVDRAV
jgi:flagellar protein FlaG